MKPCRVSVVSGYNQPCFGNISMQAKSVINDSGIRTILERKYGISAKELRKMDASALKFSLLSEISPNLPTTAGLYVVPPKGSDLPAVSISDSIIDAAVPDAYSFADAVRKAFKMQEVYEKAIKNYGVHPIKKALSSKLAQVEKRTRGIVRNYLYGYNARNFELVDQLSDDFCANEAKKSRLNSAGNSKLKEARKLVVENVIPHWEYISGKSLSREFA